MVLAALYATEHLVGAQGLFLALPVTVFAFKLVMGAQASGDDEDVEGRRKL